MSDTELRAAAEVAGVADARNTPTYVRRMVARVAWLNANATERERRRKAALEARPTRLALLARATMKRRRKAARRLNILMMESR